MPVDDRAAAIDDTTLAVHVSREERESLRNADEDAITTTVRSAMRWAQAGDRQAQAFLYARFAEDVYGRARMIVDDHETSIDITRRVFAELTNDLESDGARLERLLGSHRVRPG
jgi:hypothetical protein